MSAGWVFYESPVDIVRAIVWIFFFVTVFVGIPAMRKNRRRR